MNQTFLSQFPPALSQKMVEIRRQLHRRPELALHETATAEYIETRLQELGIPCARCAGTGVVGLIDGGGDTTIGIRADIDALPVSEQNDIPYRSEHPGVMHACGHDGHVAMALGAAELLGRMKREGRLPGRVKLLFQPAEEQFGGAQRMIDAGALHHPDVQAVVALHIWPALEKGRVFCREGCVMASNDRVRITIRGSGGHGAMPQLCRDALTAGCQVIGGVQTFLTRELDPQEPQVVTFGTFHSGTTYNIVSDRTVIEGTVRTVSEATRAKIENRMGEIAKGICASMHVECDFEYIRQFPPTFNHPALTRLCRQAAADALGESRTGSFDRPFMTAEDFACFGNCVPVFLGFLGAREPERDYPLHHARFNFDENLLTVGAAFEAAAALRFLQSGGLPAGE